MEARFPAAKAPARRTFCSCYTEGADGANGPGISGENEQDDDCDQDHQIGIEQDEDAGMIETPLSPQAAGGFAHAPCGGQKDQNLPVRATEVPAIGKASQAQTRGKGA